MSAESFVPQKILECIRDKQVISIREISQIFGLSSITAKNYLSRLAQSGEIKSIGRGLYQVGKGETVVMRLSSELVRIAEELRGAFPMAKFAIWSLQMLSDYSHYMIGKDIIFIETTKMLSASMRDMLVSKGYRVILQPEKRDFREFAYYSERPVFILERKESYGLTEFEGNQIPTPERIWTDVYYFSTRKNLVFDPFELGLIFSAMVDREGINFDRLLRYAGRRGIFREILIFLYELMKSNSKVGKRVTEHILLGKRETLNTITTMVEGAKRND
jgi:DNA-binding Lrp family transcriptional regulator